MNGHDLLMILSEAMTLPEFLKQRVRLLGKLIGASLSSVHVTCTIDNIEQKLRRYDHPATTHP
jgi:hypothetical protein